ncbi:MAG: LamG domain-containing protein [Bdellovibrio sp.]|nr:LamG domain-containing protein [Bdellovibrio sp.]
MNVKFRRILPWLLLRFFAFYFCAIAVTEAQVIIPLAYWRVICLSSINNIDNNITTGFGAGTLTGINWSGTALVLNAATASGTYVSPPFNFSDCYNTPWKNLSWTASLPFGKEIPATSEIAADYSAINGGLATGLRGLWHLNETAGTVIADSSGAGNTGTLQGTATLGATGILFKAVTFNGSTGYVSTTNSFVNPSIFTVAVWFKTTTTAGGKLIGLGNNITGSSGNYDRHIYMDNSGGINFGVYPGSVKIVTSAGPYNDGLWHQAVGTLSAAGLQLYMDGTLKATDASVTTAQNYTGYVRIAYDNMNGWTNQPTSPFFGGTIDEAAFWTRALSTTEVRQLYQRGGNRIKFQVRKCTLASCADNPAWLGPDGTSATFFTEVNNNSNQNLSNGAVTIAAPNLLFANFTGLILINTVAFQYKIIFESDNTAYSPDVRSVFIGH